MTPELRALLDLYRDTPRTKPIVLQGLDQLRLLQRDPSFVPPRLASALLKQFQ